MLSKTLAIARRVLAMAASIPLLIVVLLIVPLAALIRWIDPSVSSITINKD